VRKEGSAFYLLIAVGILAASSQIRTCRSGRFILVGELSLDGTLRPARGVLCMASAARNRGGYGIIVPAANGSEAALADGPVVYAVSTLRETVEIIEGRVERAPFESSLARQLSRARSTGDDFSDVRGQVQAKRALDMEGGYPNRTRTTS
jgi:magnesium chelatase family protein